MTREDTDMQRILLSAALLTGLALKAAYEKPANPLMTEWGAAVTPENAWREYPRPHLVRDKWLNLNGLWEYAITTREAGCPQKWDGEILVPFAIETPLSGVKRLTEPDEQLWYRRSFQAAFQPESERLLLHFGAVDFRAQVFVNGIEVTDVPHESGNLPFTVDITEAARPGDNELVVSVWDPTGNGYQSIGKQSLKPEGCFYTRSSGIWQTVWLETVPSTYIAGYRVVTDIDRQTVAVTLLPAGDLMKAKAEVTVLKDGKKVASAKVTAWDKPVVLPVPKARLWSPETPELYDLTLTLKGQNSAQDVAKGYFGMRKIEWRKDEKGVPRFYLNNRKTFMYGTLDQGWWPDGFLTPPSDDAMRFDIQFLKDCGFNMMRKHIKIEPLRYYYLCDTMGILLWQDMPSGFGDVENRYQLYRQELKEMLDLLQTFPSIVMWVPYNEGWGQPQAPKTNQVQTWVKQYDPTRLVNGPSGWNDYGVGDTRDKHNYPEPQMFPVMENRVSVLGEFGGIGFMVKGHLWQARSWGYVTDANVEEYFSRYESQVRSLARMAFMGLAAAVYTQTTDVEGETNGLLTYDRKVAKCPAEKFAAVHQQVYEAAKVTRLPVPTVILPTGQQGGATWRYVVNAPTTENWMAPDFDDTAWKEGQAGFGNAVIADDNSHVQIRTPWEGKDIWLRRTFTVAETAFEDLQLNIFHDEGAEVYLNGVKIASLRGYLTSYEAVMADIGAVKALKPGLNTLAVHVHNKKGGAYIDLGLSGVNYK